MSINHDFRSSLPSDEERRRMVPLAASEHIVRAFEEALAEVGRRGERPTIGNAAKLMRCDPSIYRSARDHVLAVRIYRISPQLGKQAVLRRLRELEPNPLMVARKAAELEDSRSDPEILAQAIVELLLLINERFSAYDVTAIAAPLSRYPSERGAAKNAARDVISWVSSLEAAL